MQRTSDSILFVSILFFSILFLSLDATNRWANTPHANGANTNPTPKSSKLPSTKQLCGGASESSTSFFGTARLASSQKTVTPDHRAFMRRKTNTWSAGNFSWLRNFNSKLYVGSHWSSTRKSCDGAIKRGIVSCILKLKIKNKCCCDRNFSRQIQHASASLLLLAVSMASMISIKTD